MIARRLPLLLPLLVAGCATMEGHYDRTALEGTNASVGGMWVSTAAPCQELWVEEKGGGEIGGWWTDFDGNLWLTEGQLKGRVIRGKMTGSVARAYNGIQGYGFLFALTVSQDGKAAEFAMNVTDIENNSLGVQKAAFVRYQDGEAYNRLRPDPLTRGMLIAPLQFTADGVASGITGNGASVREAIGTLSFIRNMQGGLVASRIVLPVEGPRRATRINYPGPGHFTKLWDRGSFLHWRRQSPGFRAREATFDGRKCWWIVAPSWDLNATDLTPTVAFGELYLDDPYGPTSPMPVEYVEVARRGGDGSWKAVENVLSVGQTLLAARGVITQGAPDGVEVYEPEAPSIEPFLVAKEGSIAQARWRTRALVSVKNRTLPRLLADAKTSELASLAERIEQLILDLNHESEVARDRAQQLVETNSGSPDELRELSLVYKERLEVLKPIVGALKEEIANRNR